MARGGSRPGAGRKPGQTTKLNEEARKTAAEGGLMPLDYLLTIMRDIDKPQDERVDAAKAAAPYVHAKLSTVDMKAEVSHRAVMRMPEVAKDAAEWITKSSGSPKQAPKQH